MLCSKSLHKALKLLKFIPEADMIVSYINYQFHTYSQYKAHPKPEVVKSFIVSLRFLKSLPFPPFSVISRSLKKIKAGKVEGV